MFDPYDQDLHCALTRGVKTELEGRMGQARGLSFFAVPKVLAIDSAS